MIEAIRQPATAILIVTCCIIWFFLQKRSLGYSEVGMSYDRVVCGQELWRLVTSQLSHVDLLHLVFNLSALWSVGIVERSNVLGTIYYIQQSSLLFVMSPVICLGLYHAMIYVAKREEYRSVTAVGYSCVIFGWMTILAVRQPGGISMLPLFGLASMPMYLAPFASLVITSVLIPKASFLGHLSGIIAGYAISTGVFDALGPLGAVALLVLALAGVAGVAVRNNQLRIPGYMQLSGEGVDVEGGSGGGAGQLRIVNGVIQRG